MLDILRTALPEPAQWLGLGATLAVTLAFSGLGRIGFAAARSVPGLSVLTGWTVVAFVLTAIGVFTGWPFAPVFWGLMAAGAVALAVSLGSGGLDRQTVALLRVFALGLPFLVIVAAKAPSEVDSFTHWLPNGAYLAHHDRFLRPGGPPSMSAYPGFPYNLTFILYAVGRLAAGFVENAVIQFNVVLLLLFAAVVAWLIRKGAEDERAPGWTLAALAILIATALNPVFLHRVWLSSYPDNATSVVVAFAGICGWQWVEALRRGGAPERGRAASFALVLALLTNIKQANPVLVAGILAGVALIALRDPAIGLGKFAKRLPLVVGPALALYAFWSYYLLAIAALRTNEIHPIASWPLDKLPALLAGMASVAAHKGGYFALALLLTGWGAWAWVRRPATPFDRLAVIAGATFVVYTLFLLFIFLAHFNGYPQSYWRYNTHVGFLLTAVAAYGAAVGYGRWRAKRPRAWSRRVRATAATVIVVVPLIEIGFLRYWRLDMELPKPLLREAGRDLARTLPADAAVIVLIPSDAGNFSAILKYYATASRPDLHVGAARNARTAATAARLVTPDRPDYVWSYCAQPALDRGLGLAIPPGRAALLARTKAGWTVARTWPHGTPGGLFSTAKEFDAASCGG